MANRSKKEGVTFTWNGDDVKKRAEKLAQKSSFEIGLQVEADAKMLAPRDSGRLSGSICTVSGMGQRTKPRGKGAQAEDVIAQPDDKFETFVGTPVEYAPYMEYGTIKTSAQPFLRPALDLSRGKASKIVQVGARKEFGDYLHPKDQWKQAPEGFTE